jgi:hypothetical protein
MTRDELEQFIISTTEPHNAGASEPACRIVRMMFQHEGMARVAVADAENRTGFIAHLCRRVASELKTIQSEVDFARDCQVAEHFEDAG